MKAQHTYTLTVPAGVQPMTEEQMQAAVDQHYGDVSLVVVEQQNAACLWKWWNLTDDWVTGCGYHVDVKHGRCPHCGGVVEERQA